MGATSRWNVAGAVPAVCAPRSMVTIASATTAESKPVVVVKPQAFIVAPDCELEDVLDRNLHHPGTAVARDDAAEPRVAHRGNGIAQPQAVGDVEGLDPKLDLLRHANRDLAGHRLVPLPEGRTSQA